MKRIAVVLAAIAVLMTFAMPAYAVVDEIVAAYCSADGNGGPFDGQQLSPPGISDDTKSNFAAPVLRSGAVEVTPGPDVSITDHPAAKYPPQTFIDDGAFVGLTPPDHPSTACVND